MEVKLTFDEDKLNEVVSKIVEQKIKELPQPQQLTITEDTVKEIANRAKFEAVRNCLEITRAEDNATHSALDAQLVDIKNTLNEYDQRIRSSELYMYNSTQQFLKQMTEKIEEHKLNIARLESQIKALAMRTLNTTTITG